MITDFIVGIEMLGIVSLVIYAMADNDRLYGSIFASFIACILSAIVSYQFLFGLIISGSGVTIQDSSVGYFFMMIAIGTFALPVIIFINGWLIKKDKKSRGVR